MTEGYDLLAIAILNRAVEDYRAIRKKLNTYKRYYTESEVLYIEHQLFEIEQFFISDYGNLLSHGLGAEIVHRLQTERK